MCFETYWNGMKAAAMPAHPANENKMTVVHGYAADGNTRYGDCVECALVHMVETFRALAGHPITFTEAQTLALYSAITGFDPAKPETDQGTALLDALKFWKNCGVTGPDGVAHTIGAFVAIDITNLDAVEAALHLFDGIFLGVGLPKTAQTQRLWDVVGDGKTGDSAPYSWGGHCVPYL
ncbi:MAG TPA: hypothetical protein VFA70_06270, partial [Dehalococcoidia bacterium]|nr:hypothetical protein [Dehalococcoidia bacterium]